MNTVEKLLDLKAVILQDTNEENLFAFSIALLDAPLFIPCMFLADEDEPDFQILSNSNRELYLKGKARISCR